VKSNAVSRDSSPVSVAASTPSAKRKPAMRTPKPKSGPASKKKPTPFTPNNTNNDESGREGEKDVVKPKISRLEESDDDNSVKSEKSDASRDSSPVSLAASTGSAKRKPTGHTPKPKSGTASKKKASQHDDDKLKKEAEKDVVKPKICRLEESDDADVKKYFKKAEKNGKKPATLPPITPKLVANPFSKTPTAPGASGPDESNAQKLAPNPFAKDKKKSVEATTEKLAPNPFAKADKKKPIIEAPDTNDADADTAPTTPIQKMASNPFFKGGSAAITTTPQTKSTPQKRRLADSDKKVVNKASKKARQESSSSGDDSALEEAKNKRSKEIPASAKARARKSSESSSVDDAKVRKSNIKAASDSEKSGKNSRDSSPSAAAVTTTKRKPGPKSKPKPGPAASKKPGSETKSAVNTMAFGDGDSITCCEDCDKIFISRQAYLNHKKDMHETKRASESAKSGSSDSDHEPVKKSPIKPGPRTKKTKAKISEERRKSNRSSSSSSDDDEPKQEKSKSARRPGPKSKLSKGNDSTPTQKKTPKAGPASKMKRNGTTNSKNSSSIDSDSDSDKGKKESETKPSNKVKGKISSENQTPTIKKTDHRNSIGDIKDSYRCRFCTTEKQNQLGLRNHVLDHFKEDLMKVLPQQPTVPTPSGLQYECPECKAPSRDKTTLLRHYSFGHKKVFEFCDESDFKPRPKDHPIKSVPKGNKFKTGATTPLVTKKSRKSPEKFMPDLTDSDTDIPKKKPVKQNDILSKETEVKSDSKLEKSTFSSDEDDWTNIANKTKETIKSFDELFNAEKSDKKVNEEKENKDGVKA